MTPSEVQREEREKERGQERGVAVKRRGIKRERECGVACKRLDQRRLAEVNEYCISDYVRWNWCEAESSCAIMLHDKTRLGEGETLVWSIFSYSERYE